MLHAPSAASSCGFTSLQVGASKPFAFSFLGFHGVGAGAAGAAISVRPFKQKS